ncbi:TonB-linked SusC/RagA family outer membrane protein [Sediminitomix flava]|uniref:TonB-linked SusC/RagA family outer membrane protein n=2 Tax=Sediminitomix flava TaxID=379075 RepID=A0A315Z998_SEDFL|nr:TonB-linked SusC/RagA family outer membrane protein [Sediminitomix flava]
MALAQERQVTGAVTDASGEPLPGVAVQVVGTTTGSITSFEGIYTVNVPEGGEQLAFSSVGFVTKTVAIGAQSKIDVTLEEDAEQLEEVVVTALGISRDKASLGYAVQSVDGAKLQESQPSSAMSALSGNVAGVQVSGGGGMMGGSTRVLVRGASSISGNNEPLYVVDGVPLDNSNFNSGDAARGAGGYDYGNMALDINPDDIESMSVLKGPAAAALYGSRAANGVVMITTKKGSAGQKGIGVEINSSVAFEKITRMANLQRQYGGGFGDFSETYNYNGTDYPVAFFAMDESWGPKYEGQQVVQWHNIDMNGNVTGTSAWEAPKNDVEDFFELGVGFKNSVAVVGNNEKGSFRLSYTNQTASGTMPNHELSKNGISLNSSYKLTDKLSAQAVINFMNTETTARPMTGYDGGNVMQQFTQWGQRQLDMERLSNYKNEDGTQRTWNRKSLTDASPKYSDNPYWTRYENYQNDERDRYYGNVGFTYKLTDWLTASGKVYGDMYTFTVNERTAVGSQGQSGFSQLIENFKEFNYEGMLAFNKDLGSDFNLSGNIGINQRHMVRENMYGTTVGGLQLPGVYTLTNSIDPSIVTNSKYEKKVNSVLGSASLGWRNMLYLDLGARNDWSSTLPTENNSFFYPSVTTSFVFSELAALQNLSWLDFGKVRLGAAQVGNDTDPYMLRETYVNTDGVGFDYSVPNTLLAEDLKPEITQSWEVGLEGSLFDNRLTFDATYYENKTKDLITTVALSGASGYYFQMMNAGVMENKGIELQLGGDIVRTSDFNWNVSVNFSKNMNTLLELADGIDNYRMANGPFAVSVNAFVGQSYGAIMGTNYVFHEETGKPIVGEDGRYEVSGTEVLGTVVPDYNLGIRNTFSYKNLDFSFLIDKQEGGSYHSVTHMFGMYSGMLEETAANGVRENGIVLDAVYADGTPNTTAIDATRWGADHYAGPQAQNVFDASYVKLRDVTIGYTFPSSLFDGYVQSLRISAYGRNLAMWGLANDHIDPEMAVTSSGNVQGLEGAALPSTATFGMSLSAKF